MSPAGCFQSGRGKSRRPRNENKGEEEYRVRVLQQMIWLREKERRRRLVEEEEQQQQESLLLRQLAAIRDEAVVGSKWKHLYFAIKVQLDRLILTTTNSIGSDMEREVRGKEEEIRVLESRIAFLEQQELRRLREVDILRQSLRIMFYNNHKNTNKVLSSGLFISNN